MYPITEIQQQPLVGHVRVTGELSIPLYTEPDRSTNRTTHRTIHVPERENRHTLAANG